MNGLIRKTFAGLFLGTGALASGCMEYRQHVDPCWPERYISQARQSVHQATDSQAANGHVLDQTIWNWHFDPGSDRLNPAGMEKIQYLVRRRPVPDPKVYLQTAQDLPDREADWDILPQKRSELDQRRVVMLQRYFSSQMASRPECQGFQIAIHDATPPGIPAKVYVGYTAGVTAGSVGIGAYDMFYNNFRGSVIGGVTTSGGGGGGGAPTGLPGTAGGGQAPPQTGGGQPGTTGGGTGGGTGQPPTN